MKDINYGLRPAKNVERKMICEALIRLSHFANLGKYRYVGFGSYYFIDFVLIHRLLGIKDLTSIERDIHRKLRYDFNKPFECIKILYGESFERLPEMEWKKLTILWLDYTSKLNLKMFEDIETFFTKAPIGSIFLITVNIESDNVYVTPDDDENHRIILNKDSTPQQTRINLLKNRVGELRLPSDIDDKILNNKDNINVIYNIINNEILDVLRKRNGLNESNKIIYDQLFNFTYKDGALMLTVGGLIYDDKNKEIFNKMNYDNLEFIRRKNEPFSIEIPCFTSKEINSLDTFLPGNIDTETGAFKGKLGDCNLKFLKAQDIKTYSKIYRYFPSFAETIL